MGTRITNGMMVGNFNRNMTMANERMYKYQSQLATGRKMVRLSDDPVSVVKSLNARAQLYNIEQYQKNLEDANAWLTQTESALKEMNELIKRAYELSVYAATDTLSEEDRNAIASEIGELRGQVEVLSNTTLGDRYIFGGYNVTKAPFEYDPETGDVLYNGESMIDGDIDWDNTKYQINFGLEFDVAMTAGSAFGVEEENAYYILTNMFNLISSSSELNEDGYVLMHEDIAPYPQILLDLQSRVLTQIAETGGRIARVDLMSDRFSNDKINYTQMQSDVEDLDQAEAIMWFSMTESVYRSALGVGGRILPPSLMDFLR